MLYKGLPVKFIFETIFEVKAASLFLNGNKLKFQTVAHIKSTHLQLSLWARRQTEKVTISKSYFLNTGRKANQK